MSEEGEEADQSTETLQVSKTKFSFILETYLIRSKDI
jgi:hypothetical protein